MVHKPLVEARNLKKHFRVGKDAVLRAVDGVSFAIDRGETFGLVGESGCGKTTVGRTMMRLHQPDGGQVMFDGDDVHRLDRSTTQRLSRRMQMIFQDPYASLNPRLTVGDSIAEGLVIHKVNANRRENRERVRQLLELVGMNEDHADRFPHEMSGGQRQRIGIARALALHPDFIVCDEAVSALDVSIQAQIVNLLMDLQQRLGLTYLFITHDLRLVQHITDRTAVMYLGTIAETAATSEIFANPLHPYTKGLLSAAPIADPLYERSRERILLTGDVPSPINPGPGCRFKSRCPIATSICAEKSPDLIEPAPGHFVACHHV